MLSKGSVAILPVLLLGIVLWLRPLTRQDLLRIMPFFAVAVALTVVNVWFQRHGSGEIIRSADFAQRILGAGGVVWFYLYKAISASEPAFHLSPVAHRIRQSAMVAAFVGGIDGHGNSVAV